MKKFILALGLVSLNVLSAGGGGHHDASIVDLIFPAVNFIIFAGILYWKMNPMLKKHYEEKNKNISQFIERAQYKSFEANTKLEQQKKKMESLNFTIENLKTEMKKNIEKYKEQKLKEAEEQIDKLGADSRMKITAEKNQYLKEINNELSNQIIALVKNKVASNSKLAEEINSSFLKGIQ
jgi:F-type H+-transporting ATPase subunit b